MIGAETAYANAANAAAAAFAAAPASISYRVDIETHAGTAVYREASAVELRTGDGSAIVRDANGTPRSGAPPALPAALDPLGDWAFSAQLNDGRVVMHVVYEHPKQYAFPTPGPQADVVVKSIAGYDVRFAAGDVQHIELSPATAETRAFAAQPNHFVYRDVFIDAVTALPSRVVLTAPDETLTLDFGTFDGHWLLSHLDYDAVQHMNRHTERRYTVEASYSDYAFAG